MNTQLYEYEKKLNLCKTELCTPSEVNAIKTILAQGKKLPAGIIQDKHGKYHKFVSSTLSDSDKDRIVAYKTLISNNRILSMLYLLVGITCALTLVAAAICLLISIAMS